MNWCSLNFRTGFAPFLRNAAQRLWRPTDIAILDVLLDTDALLDPGCEWAREKCLHGNGRPFEHGSLQLRVIGRASCHGNQRFFDHVVRAHSGTKETGGEIRDGFAPAEWSDFLARRHRGACPDVDHAGIAASFAQT